MIEADVPAFGIVCRIPQKNMPMAGMWLNPAGLT
jgi:hypothetical protein